MKKNFLYFYIFALCISLVSNANAIVFNEFSGMSKDMQYGYILGAVNSLLVEPNVAQSRLACIDQWGVEGAKSMLANYPKKSPEPAAGFINVGVLIALSAPNECDISKLTAKSETKISLAQFTHLSRDTQTGYVVGALDSFIVNAEYSTERSNCIEKYGIIEFWNYMLNLYNKNQNDPRALSSNPAQILLEGANAKCGSKRRVDPQNVISEGSQFPEFTLTHVRDKSRYIRKSDLLGKPALIIFWASWVDKNVGGDIASIGKLAEKGINVITVNYKDSRENAILVISSERKNISNETIDIFDPKGDLGKKLGIIGVPVAFVIDSSGVIRKRWVGAVTSEVWDKQLKEIYFK